jgi:integrase
LTFAGLRIGELIELHWRDVNPADARITMRVSKTDAGMRTVDLLPALRDELATLKAGTEASPGARVFPALDHQVADRVVERRSEPRHRLDVSGGKGQRKGITVVDIPKNS